MCRNDNKTEEKVKKIGVPGEVYPPNISDWKALKHIRSEIKQLITERHSAIPTEVVTRNVDEVARGWIGYFQYGNCTKALSYSKRYLV